MVVNFDYEYSRFVEDVVESLDVENDGEEPEENVDSIWIYRRQVEQDELMVK